MFGQYYGISKISSLEIFIEYVLLMNRFIDINSLLLLSYPPPLYSILLHNIEQRTLTFP